jgi:hypothetical protein
VATSAQGGTFTFTAAGANITADVIGLSVETPQAEVVDMTAIDDAASMVVAVPTGAWTGGSISVEYLHRAGGSDAQDIVRKVGVLTFSSAGYSVSRRAILESATTDASVGALVRGTLRFRLTDYTGT